MPLVVACLLALIIAIPVTVAITAAVPGAAGVLLAFVANFAIGGLLGSFAD